MPKMTISSPKMLEASIYEELMDNFPDIVHSVDEDGNIIFTNKKAAELLKYSKEELLGMNVRNIYAPEVLEKLETGFSKLKQDGDLTVYDSCLVDSEDERIEVEIRSFALYDDEGKFIRTFSVLRDIRERINLEKQLVHSSRLAAVGELSSCVAHDISNPLAVVKLYCEMMLGMVDTCEPASLREQIEATQEAAGKIEKLVSHMRNFARAGEKKFSKVDIAEVIKGALFMISAKIGSVVVDNRIDYGHYIVGASNELEQVFMNLFSNACDAMKSQTKDDKTLLIWLEETDTEFEVYVRDSGEGIDPSVLEHMFKAFYTTKGVGHGTGLGLSISKTIIHKHEGRIHVESELGEGTVFVIYLPKVAKPAKK